MMTSNFKRFSPTATVQEVAGLLIEDGEYLGGMTNMLRECPVFCQEYEEALAFVHAFDCVEEYGSIRFMLACFTLLLEGDDNF